MLSDERLTEIAQWGRTSRAVEFVPDLVLEVERQRAEIGRLRLALQHIIAYPDCVSLACIIEARAALESSAQASAPKEDGR